MNRQQRHALVGLWRADLYRHLGGQSGVAAGLRAYRLVPGFRFMFWLRLAAMTRSSAGLWRPLHVVARLMHRRLRFQFGISIPYTTRIGAGLYIGHWGGIVVNEAAVIGCNCNISHGVTIGQLNRGARKGVPSIGDAVYIGPGAAIIGAVTVGSGCAIGANAVVSRDLCYNAVAVGVPAKIVSLAGSAGYVAFCDYPPVAALASSDANSASVATTQGADAGPTMTSSATGPNGPGALAAQCAPSGPGLPSGASVPSRPSERACEGEPSGSSSAVGSSGSSASKGPSSASWLPDVAGNAHRTSPARELPSGVRDA